MSDFMNRTVMVLTEEVRRMRDAAERVHLVTEALRLRGARDCPVEVTDEDVDFFQEADERPVVRDFRVVG